MSRFCQCRLQLEEMRKNEDPRLSFSTPEFKEAQRIFTGGLKVISMISTGRQHAVVVHLTHGLLLAHGLKLKHVPAIWMLFMPRGHICTCLQGNFNKPVEWGLIKDQAWSTPQLRKLETPVSPSRRLSAWSGIVSHGLAGNGC